MAFVDTSLQLSNAQAITTTAASTTLYDVTGAGSGVAPSMIFGLSGTKPGADIGTGDGMAIPYAYFSIGVTGTGAGTVTFSVQAAPDNGSNSPGTYLTLASSAAYVGTTLLAGNVISFPIPPYAQVAPAMGLPRFYRFNYTVSGSATVTVTSYIMLNPPLGYVSTQYPPNYLSV